MKKYYLLIATIFTTFILTACGMTSEDITAYMTSLDASYQSGAYEQAQSEVEKLDKAYKKMTDDQKTKFDELKSSVQYAAESAPAINNALDNVQSMLDQEKYDEASEALEKIDNDYTLPPAEQKKFDEKKTAADTGIRALKAAEALQNAESLLNSGDYNAASAELDNVDTSLLSEEQQEAHQSLQIKISDAKAAAEAKAKAAAEAKAKADAQNKAKQVALSACPGGRVKSITESNHNGLPVYEVVVNRGDANTMFYVSKASGTIVESISMPGEAQIEYDRNN